MSKSTHNIAINAKDNTATAFQSIQARAKLTKAAKKKGAK